MARLVIGQKHGSDAEQPSTRASWNTPHPTPRTGMSYGGRMALSFAMTSLVTVIILACVVTVVWGGAFSDYTRANVEEIAQVAAEKLAEGYERAGEWNVDDIKDIAESSALSDDIGMQVTDTSGVIMYDDTWPAAAMASGAGESGVRKDSHSPVSKAPTDPESAVVTPIVNSEGEGIGQVRLWVLGSDALLTKADTAFRERTFNAMGLAAFIAVLMAIVIGFLVSRMFTYPVRTITNTARRIREGDLSARTNMRGDDEIDQLGETFDEMAASLERDLKRERRLTSDVAHELRTPLMAMQATVEAMQDGVYPTDAEHLETVAGATDARPVALGKPYGAVAPRSGRYGAAHADHREQPASAVPQQGPASALCGRDGGSFGGDYLRCRHDHAVHHQPHEQRHALHTRGRLGGRLRARGPQVRDGHGVGYGHRHRQGRPRADIRQVLAGGAVPVRPVAWAWALP